MISKKLSIQDNKVIRLEVNPMMHAWILSQTTIKYFQAATSKASEIKLLRYSFTKWLYQWLRLSKQSIRLHAIIRLHAVLHSTSQRESAVLSVSLTQKFLGLITIGHSDHCYCMRKMSEESHLLVHQISHTWRQEGIEKVDGVSNCAYKQQNRDEVRIGQTRKGMN